MIGNSFKSVLLHLRFPFSLFLLPVFLFAIATVPMLNNAHAFWVFIILHLLVYPASNGYNSYFDKDEGSIALLKTPPKVNYALYVCSVCLEWLSVALSFLISWQFAVCVLVYNSLSKAYSHPKIRLKKYPYLSFLTVFIFQGAFIYYSVYFAVAEVNFGFIADVFLAGIICSCLIGASYPLTQIYQHEEDRKRGDVTLSMKLGYSGSFIFSGILFLAGTILMGFFCYRRLALADFWVFLACGSPVIGFFSAWFAKVIQDKKNANFKYMMQMTLISSSMMLIYFTWLCIWG